MKICLLFLLALIQGLLGQNTCNYQNGDFNINWNLDSSNNVRFNLTYSNFPQNGDYWIGFGYWENKVVLVESLNGAVEITTADINSNQPTKTVGSNVLQNPSGILSNGRLQAEFSIPYQALSAASGGQSCMDWQFYTSPTQNGTSYSGSPQSQQVCNLQQTCNVDGGQNNQLYDTTSSPYGQSYSSTPSPYNQAYQPQYNPSAQFNQGYQSTSYPQNTQYTQGYQAQPQFNPNSQFYQNQQYSNPVYANQFNPSSGYPTTQFPQQNFQQYDPSNPNIQYYPYTFNQGFSGNYNGNQLRPQYDAPPQTTSNSDFVIENPNYQFLSPQLNQEFKSNQKGNQNGIFFDQNGVTVTTTTEPPILTNEQQNQVNYQRILQNPPTTANPGFYTNNIYGYDYRSNANMPYTVNGNPQQYLPPEVRKFQPASGSPFRVKRQPNSPSASAFNSGSLVGTAYEGQDTQFIRNDNYGLFFDSVVNPVYNTSTQPTPYQQFNDNTNQNYNSGYYNPNTNTQYNYNNNLTPQFDSNNPIYYPYLTPVANPNSPDYERILQQDAAAQQAFEDPNCTGTDPYWCANYVQNFMLWQNQYDGSNPQPNQAQAAMRPSQSACSALIDSLKSAYHRCCQTVRTAGCQ